MWSDGNLATAPHRSKSPSTSPPSFLQQFINLSAADPNDPTARYAFPTAAPEETFERTKRPFLPPGNVARPHPSYLPAIDSTTVENSSRKKNAMETRWLKPQAFEEDRPQYVVQGTRSADELGPAKSSGWGGHFRSYIGHKTLGEDRLNLPSKRRKTVRVHLTAPQDGVATLELRKNNGQLDYYVDEFGNVCQRILPTVPRIPPPKLPPVKKPPRILVPVPHVPEVRKPRPKKIIEPPPPKPPDVTNKFEKLSPIERKKIIAEEPSADRSKKTPQRPPIDVQERIQRRKSIVTSAPPAMPAPEADIAEENEPTEAEIADEDFPIVISVEETVPVPEPRIPETVVAAEPVKGTPSVRRESVAPAPAPAKTKDPPPPAAVPKPVPKPAPVVPVPPRSMSVVDQAPPPSLPIPTPSAPSKTTPVVENEKVSAQKVPTQQQNGNRAMMEKARLDREREDRQKQLSMARRSSIKPQPPARRKLSTVAGLVPEEPTITMDDIWSDKQLLDEDTRVRLGRLTQHLFAEEPELPIANLADALQGISTDPTNPNAKLTKSEVDYIVEVFELVDHGQVNQRELCIIAALAERMTLIDTKLRTSFFSTDFKKLGRHIKNYKALFAVNNNCGKMNVDDIRIMLKASGLGDDEIGKAFDNLHLPDEQVDFLDFLSYVPFFVRVHKNILNNVLDNNMEGTAEELLTAGNMD